MLVVTNLVLPCVTESNSQCYDTTHQRFHFARGLLDFYRLVVTNLVRSTDDNVHLRKLETAYLSHSARGQQRRGFWRADPPEGGVSCGNSCGTHSHLQKASKTVSAQKKRGEK
jgi:hypothetical protein